MDYLFIYNDLNWKNLNILRILEFKLLSIRAKIYANKCLSGTENTAAAL